MLVGALSRGPSIWNSWFLGHFDQLCRKFFPVARQMLSWTTVPCAGSRHALEAVGPALGLDGLLLAAGSGSPGQQWPPRHHGER